MPDEQFKRNIAFKMRIGEILVGKPIMDGERFGNLEINGNKIVRVNVVGSIVDKYESSGEKKYVFLTLDDGSGQIKLKSFGDDAQKSLEIQQGETVAVIGLLRFFNNEIYISPEIIKEQDPKYLLVRKLELDNAPKIQNNIQTLISQREKIIELIKNSESQGGIDIEKINSVSGISAENAAAEIQKLLEEGVIFEPRPGKVRWLG
ncbi:OB-fold nucleic acid binding domain-containing protein [Candidatus Pacearchaeota archaeon]|nr:OB-fold nucleic acid binding domain-containing protein [Candidatus Pacearchaeota archaeon]